jgi:type II restriction enzyme
MSAISTPKNKIKYGQYFTPLHVSEMIPRFTGTQREWTREYLTHFVTQAKRRADDMLERFVRPFEKYL